MSCAGLSEGGPPEQERHFRSKRRAKAVSIYRKNKNGFRRELSASFCCSQPAGNEARADRVRDNLLGIESSRERLTLSQALGDGPNAWLDPGYRLADLPRSTSAMNSAISVVEDLAGSSALGVQTVQRMS